MNPCLFSFIIPMYNSQKSIKETLLSIFLQEDCTYDEFEIICIDDASTDNTASIVEDFKHKYSNLFLVKNIKNSGCSFSRNKGLELAKGEYIIFVDADDIVSNNLISKLRKKISSLQPDLIAYNAEIFTPDTRSKFLQNSYYLNFINKGELQYLAFITNLWCCCINRELLLSEKIMFDEKRIFEDWLFLWKVYGKIKTSLYIDEPLYFYRANYFENTLTTNFRKKENDIKGLFSVYYEAKNSFSKEKWNQFEYICLIRANEIFLHFLRSKHFSYKELVEFKNEYRLFLNSIPEVLFLRLFKNGCGWAVFLLINSIKNNGFISKIYNPNYKIEKYCRKCLLEINVLLRPIRSIFNYIFTILKLFKNIMILFLKSLYSVIRISK